MLGWHTSIRFYTKQISFVTYLAPFNSMLDTIQALSSIILLMYVGDNYLYDFVTSPPSIGDSDVNN